MSGQEDTVKTFDSTKHPVFLMIFIGIPVFLAAALLNLTLPVIQTGRPNISLKITVTVLLVLMILTLWKAANSFMNARYTINEQSLTYKIGVFHGAIPISQMRSISSSRYPLAGNRPALDLEGLLITYGEGYSIFVTPKSAKEFIRVLAKVNKNIIIQFVEK